MRSRVIAAVLMCLFYAVPAFGQRGLAVNETAMKAVLENKSLRIDMPINNRTNASAASLRLEILDPYDVVIAKLESVHSLRPGAQVISPVVEFGTTESTLDMLWNRLRYTVWVEGTPNVVSDVVALSEIMSELFELQVTAPEYIYAGMNARAHVLAIHPYSKKPIRNVNISGSVTIDLETDDDEDEIKIAASGKTNAEGFATLDFKIPDKAHLAWDGDIEIEGKKGGIVRKIDEDLEISTGSRVYLQTDKPIYQPGQKLFVRGIYLDPRRRPMAGREVEFEILDEDDETVHSQTLTTSRFGIANLEWQLPANFKLGNYKIGVESDDDVIGMSEFKVSRYDIPNFTVNAKTDKPFYLPDQGTASISVNADYLFGKRVTKGKVRVVHEKQREWNFIDQEYETETGAEFEGETDTDGNYTFSVDLSSEHEVAKNDQWKRFHDVKFVAYFTDLTTNRTEQRRFDLRITKEPIHVYLARYEMDISPDLLLQYYVSTFYADGTPAKCDITIGGYYENAITAEMIGRGRTNFYGAAKMEIRVPRKPFPEAKDRFNYKITAVDKDGKRGGFADNFYVSQKAKQLFVDTDKTIYSPEQPIEVRLLSTSEGETVFIDVLKKSSVIYSKRLIVNKDNRATFRIPYRPDFAGELNISANFFAESRYDETAGFTKTVIYPTQGGIGLDLRSLKASYRPGENARIAFNVKDGRGFGMESALGIVVLDKAIEERVRTEQLPDNLADMRKLLGTDEMFGDLTRRDLDKIDVSRPISSELQLAAEFLLVRKH